MEVSKDNSSNVNKSNYNENVDIIWKEDEIGYFVPSIRSDLKHND